jgi:hypothetical protein
LRTIFDSSWLRLHRGIRSSPSVPSRVVALLLPRRATSIIDAAGVGCDRSTVSRHCSMIHGDSRPTRSRGNRCGRAIRSCSYIHSCYASAMRNRALGNKLRAASHQPLFPVIAALFLPFGRHDVDRPMGRGMQGPGVKFSQRASASGSGKIHKPTGPQQRGGRRLAGSGLAGHNRMTRRHNTFAPSRRIGGVTTANGPVTVGQSRKVGPEPQP